MHCSDTIPCHRGVVTVSACSFPGDCDTQSGLETVEEHISQETRATGIGDSLLGLGPWRFRLEKWSLCLITPGRGSQGSSGALCTVQSCRP